MTKFRVTKRKNVKKNLSKVLLNALYDLPAKLLEQYKNVTLAVDIMYLNKIIPFMIMTSRAIHFGMAEVIKNEIKSTLMTSLNQIIDT